MWDGVYLAVVRSGCLLGREGMRRLLVVGERGGSGSGLPPVGLDFGILHPKPF